MFNDLVMRRMSPHYTQFLLIIIIALIEQTFKGQLRRKMNLWSNLVPSRPFSEICFHDNRM